MLAVWLLNENISYKKQRVVIKGDVPTSCYLLDRRNKKGRCQKNGSWCLNYTLFLSLLSKMSPQLLVTKELVKEGVL